MLKLLFKNTKMIHAGRICAARLILTLLPIVVGLVLFCVFPTNLGRVLGFVMGIVIAFVILLSDLRHTVSLPITAGILRSWRYDRKYFVPRSEPQSRSEWEQVLTVNAARMRFRPAEAINGKSKNEPLYFGMKKSATLGSDALECFLLVYSAETVDGEIYKAILQDAKKRLRTYPARRKMRHLKISYGTAACAVILTDKVDAEAIERVKETVEARDGTLQPVIVDCAVHRVYTNGAKQMRTSTDADAQRLIGRLVFGTRGKIPREGGEHTDDYLTLYNRLSKQTYGEYIEEQKGSDRSIAEAEARLFEEMREGEFRFDEGIVYGMAEGKLMSLPLMPPEDFDGELTVPPPKDGMVLTYDETFLSWDKPKSQDMNERDKAVYLPRLLVYVESLGYRVKAESAEDDED